MGETVQSSTGDRDEVLAVVAELDACHQLGMAEHGCHALAGHVVVDGQRLVGAGGGNVHPASVQSHLDQGSVLAGCTLECPAMLPVGHSVDPDVPVLAGRQDVLVIGLEEEVVVKHFFNPCMAKNIHSALTIKNCNGKFS